MTARPQYGSNSFDAIALTPDDHMIGLLGRTHPSMFHAGGKRVGAFRTAFIPTVTVSFGSANSEARTVILSLVVRREDQASGGSMARCPRGKRSSAPSFAAGHRKSSA